MIPPADRKTTARALAQKQRARLSRLVELRGGAIRPLPAWAKPLQDFHDRRLRRFLATGELPGPANRQTGAPPPDWENAPLTLKAARLLRELRQWQLCGLPLTPPELRRARFAACQTCEYYQASGNLGLGECHAPGCGCTRAKLFLLTSRCPKNKWPKS